VRLLLDTHIALWALADSPRLPASARKLILAPQNGLFVSAATVWEIAIKHQVSRKRMPLAASRALTLFAASGYHLLSMSAEHAAAVEDLPRLHADPFDRMLVAQALREPLRLLTADHVLGRYSDTVIVC
jgi:PIN domain nuclease of toxin-antitoxin system